MDQEVSQLLETAFSVWNDLPTSLRSSFTTLGKFQSELKTIRLYFALVYWP